MMDKTTLKAGPYLTYQQVADKYFPGQTARWVKRNLVERFRVRVWEKSERRRFIEEPSVIEYLQQSTRRAARQW